MQELNTPENHVSLNPPDEVPIRRPPRSKDGCLTCRRRKVRCDEQKPRCAHCERLNLECKWRPFVRAQHNKHVPSAATQDFQPSMNTRVSRPLPNPSSLQSSATSVEESFDPLFNYASFMWDASDIWGPPPPWPNQGSHGSPDIDNYAHHQRLINPPTLLTNNGGSVTAVAQGIPLAENTTPRGVTDISGMSTTLEEVISNELDVQPTEALLIDYFVRTVVPPILAQIETQQKWSSMRQTLMSMANSSDMVLSAVLAFSDLLLSRQSTSWIKNTENHYQKSASEVARYGDFSRLGATNSSARENLLAALFFLSYIDLLEGAISSAHANLKKAYGIYQQAEKTGFRTVEARLLSWIRLLDARAVSAGGEGLFLSDADESLLVYPSPSSTGSHDTQYVDEDLEMKIEEALFDVLYQPGLTFFQKIQSFMGRISKIDPWHRSRGTVEDETEVMCIAANISRDLNKLYENRPTLMDYAVKGSLSSAHVSANLAYTITRAFRTYTSNYYASKIHLHRVAYKTLPLPRETLEAIAMIRHLTRLMVDGSDSQEMLPVNMLWPLLMWGCEENDLEERKWVNAQILNMETVATNARIMLRVLEEVQARQDATKQRVDVRRVMHDIFDSSFAIV